MFFQLKAILGVVFIVSVELIIRVYVSLLEISFDFSRPLDNFPVLDFCEYLGDRGVKRESVNSGWRSDVQGRLSLVRRLESRSGLLFLTSLR